jgi:RimJ/RimL family protein N-acetyltransferase
VADLVTGAGHRDSMVFMIPNPFEPFPRIETARLILRAPTLDDEEAMFQVGSDPLVTKYLGRAPPTRQTVREKLVKVLEGIHAGTNIIWILSDRDTGAYLGSACLWNWNEPHFRAEVGYDLASASWGRGLVTEAMTAVIRVGWERMKLHSFEGHVHPENQGSIRVLEKLGFRKEAHFRENYFNGTTFEDTVVYSLLAPSTP